MVRSSWILFAVLALAGAFLAGLLAGIRPQPRPPPGGAGPGSALGRIISAAPSVTELIFALGQGGRLVGVTDYCTYPPGELADKARIGGLHDPDRERIIKLRPDLIICAGEFAALRDFAAAHRIRIIGVQMDTLAQIREAAFTVAGELSCPEQARAVVRRFDADLQAVRERVRGLPPRSVYLCTSHKPADLARLGTCGPAGFLGELLAIAGGENVFADVQGAWPQVSKEELLRRAPALIVELHPPGMGADPAAFGQLRQDWQGLAQIPAVQNGAIHFLTDDFLFIPSLRAPLIARRLAEVIHPEAFP